MIHQTFGGSYNPDTYIDNNNVKTDTNRNMRLDKKHKTVRRMEYTIVSILFIL